MEMTNGAAPSRKAETWPLDGGRGPATVRGACFGVRSNVDGGGLLAGPRPSGSSCGPWSRAGSPGGKQLWRAVASRSRCRQSERFPSIFLDRQVEFSVALGREGVLRASHPEESLHSRFRSLTRRRLRALLPDPEAALPMEAQPGHQEGASFFPPLSPASMLRHLPSSLP